MKVFRTLYSFLIRMTDLGLQLFDFGLEFACRPLALFGLGCELFVCRHHPPVALLLSGLASLSQGHNLLLQVLVLGNHLTYLQSELGGRVPYSKPEV